MPESTEMHHGPLGGGKMAQVLPRECVGGWVCLNVDPGSEGCPGLGLCELFPP